jgi:hypothetical protein
MATGYDGKRRAYDASAFPLFGPAREMEGVVAVFWEHTSADDRTSPDAIPSMGRNPTTKSLSCPDILGGLCVWSNRVLRRTVKATHAAEPPGNPVRV